MGNATLARKRAQGIINQNRTDKLYDAGLVVIFADEYARLTARVAELEKQNRLLRDIAADSAQVSVVAAQVLREAMKP